MNVTSKIISTGSYIPERVINNIDLKNFPKASIPLIEKKTGVRSRRFADEDQCTSDLATFAARKCLEYAKIIPKKLNGIILSTSSPDRIQPATATRVQYLIEAKNAFAFDINSVCSGGISAILIADSLIRSGMYSNILVVGADIYSRYLNPKDFSTYPYFGDGAGAVLLSSTTETNIGILHSILKTDGSEADVIQIPAGGTILPGYKVKDSREYYFRMDGKKVYEFAISKGIEVIGEMLRETGINKKQIKFIIPHQANINIIKELSAKLRIEYEKFIMNVDRYGNTASASVLIGLDELFRANKVKPGDLIILVAFGGGLTWGATLIRF